MTDAQAAWLRKLRDEGDPRVPFTMEAWDAFHAGWINNDAHGVFHVTPAGLAAMAEHERALKAKGDA